jgi:hypothetical protein
MNPARWFTAMFVWIQKGAKQKETLYGMVEYNGIYMFHFLQYSATLHSAHRVYGF